MDATTRAGEDRYSGFNDLVSQLLQNLYGVARNKYRGFGGLDLFNSPMAGAARLGLMQGGSSSPDVLRYYEQRDQQEMPLMKMSPLFQQLQPDMLQEILQRRQRPQLP